MLDEPQALSAAVIVALGGNLPGTAGSPKSQLDAAVERLGDHGLTVKARSRWWRSAAWPDPRAPAFLNGVAILSTCLTPTETLDALLRLERAFGRERGATNASRTLDLDLIAHGRTVLLTSDLTLPHPRAHERLFVMGPLAEVAPGWVHPTLGKTAAQLAASASVGRDARPIKVSLHCSATDAILCGYSDTEV